MNANQPASSIAGPRNAAAQNSAQNADLERAGNQLRWGPSGNLEQLGGRKPYPAPGRQMLQRKEQLNRDLQLGYQPRNMTKNPWPLETTLPRPNPGPVVAPPSNPSNPSNPSKITLSPPHAPTMSITNMQSLAAVCSAVYGPVTTTRPPRDEYKNKNKEYKKKEYKKKEYEEVSRSDAARTLALKSLAPLTDTSALSLFLSLCLSHSLFQVLWNNSYADTFYGDKSLVYVTVAEGVVELNTGVKQKNATAGPEKGAFAACGNLRVVKLPTTLRKIGRCCFSNCASLVQVDIRSDITELGERTFYQCHNLRDLKLPTGVRHIAKQVFSGCRTFTNIELPRGIKTIDNAAFSGCTNLASINVGELNDLEWVGGFAFFGCTSLTEVDFSPLANLKSIGKHSFRECSSLATFRFPPNMTSTTEKCLYNCRSLKYVKLPNLLEVIGKSSFTSCSKSGLVLDWSSGSTTQILKHLFSLKEYVKSLRLPLDLQSLGYASIAGCTTLTSINISDLKELRSVQANAFKRCFALTEIDLSGLHNLTTFGERVFEDCVSLADVKLPPKVKSIKQCTFSNCKRLKSVLFPEDVEFVDWGTFALCNVDSIIVTIPKDISRAALNVLVKLEVQVNLLSKNGKRSLTTSEGEVNSCMEGDTIDPPTKYMKTRRKGERKRNPANTGILDRTP